MTPLLTSFVLGAATFGVQGPPKRLLALRQKPRPVVELTQAQKLSFLKGGHKNAAIESLPKIVRLDCLHLTDPITHDELSYGAKGPAWLEVDADSQGSAVLSGACQVTVFIPGGVQATSYLVVVYGSDFGASISATVNGATTNFSGPATAAIPVVVTVPPFSFQQHQGGSNVTFATLGAPGEQNMFEFQRVTVQKVTI
ncbi:MAG: hypothetical protein ACYC96_05575 [Fimbriimonadaceae bacterium]